MLLRVVCRVLLTRCVLRVKWLLLFGVLIVVVSVVASRFLRAVCYVIVAVCVVLVAVFVTFTLLPRVWCCLFCICSHASLIARWCVVSVVWCVFVCSL